MRVAVPEYQGRIAPVFDCCRRILTVVTTPQGAELYGNEDWSVVPRILRPFRLKEIAVELLLCGGISCWLEAQIQRYGIQVVPWIAGDVREALEALRNGTILHPQYAMPGRARRRHCRFGIGKRRETSLDGIRQKGDNDAGI